MTEGAFGKIYSGIDVLLSDEGAQPPRKFPIVVKFTQSHQMNDREFDAMNNIQTYVKANYDNQVQQLMEQVYSKGKVIILDPKICQIANEELHMLSIEELVDLFEK